MSYTETDVRQLGERLDSIDLATGERAALKALVRFAARKPSELTALDGDHSNSFRTVLPEIMFEL